MAFYSRYRFQAASGRPGRALDSRNAPALFDYDLPPAAPEAPAEVRHALQPVHSPGALPPFDWGNSGSAVIGCQPSPSTGSQQWWLLGTNHLSTHAM